MIDEFEMAVIELERAILAETDGDDEHDRVRRAKIALAAALAPASSERAAAGVWLVESTLKDSYEYEVKSAWPTEAAAQGEVARLQARETAEPNPFSERIFWPKFYPFTLIPAPAVAE